VKIGVHPDAKLAIIIDDLTGPALPIAHRRGSHRGRRPVTGVSDVEDLAVYPDGRGLADSLIAKVFIDVIEIDIDILQLFWLFWLSRGGQVVGGHVKYPAMLLP
jgi:hypothetical protein